MGLESGDTIAELNAAWPLGTDPRSQGDDHIRLIKRILQNDAWSKDADGAPGDYVKRSGDTMTGPLRLSAPASALYFEETDAAANAKLWLFQNNNEAIAVSARNDDGSLQKLLYRFERNGELTQDISIATRALGDGRWLQLAGGRLTGDLTLGSGTTFVEAPAGGSATLWFRDAVADVNRGVVFWERAGERMWLRALSAAGVTLADLAAGPGGIAARVANTVNLSVLAGEVQVGHAGAARLRLMRGDGASYITVDADQPIAFERGGAIVAQVMGAGTAVSTTTGIITAEKGDARYARFTTSSNAAFTDFPVGTAVFVFCDGRSYNRRASIDVRLSTANSLQYVDGPSSAAGAALTGTWRSCGAVNTGGPAYTYLAQRVG